MRPLVSMLLAVVGVVQSTCGYQCAACGHQASVNAHPRASEQTVTVRCGCCCSHKHANGDARASQRLYDCGDSQSGSIGQPSEQKSNSPDHCYCPPNVGMIGTDRIVVDRPLMTELLLIAPLPCSAGVANPSELWRENNTASASGRPSLFQLHCLLLI